MAVLHVFIATLVLSCTLASAQSGSGSGSGEPTTTMVMCTEATCGSNTLCDPDSDDFPSCSCSPGHHRAQEGAVGCDEIDNCAETPGICGTFSTCTSTGPATHECTCFNGYVSDTEDGVNCALAVKVTTKDKKVHITANDLMVDTPVMDGSITSVSFTQVVADLSSVIASAAGNAQDIETNHQDINSLLGTNVETLEGSIKDVMDAVDALDTKLGTTTTGINSNIDAVKARVQDLEDQDVATLDTLDDHKDQLSTLTSGLADLQQELGDLETNTASNLNTAINGLRTDLGKDISDLTTVVANNKKLSEDADAVFAERLKYQGYPKPDYDSGFFSFRAQAGQNSFKELTHNLGDRPEKVIAYVTIMGATGSQAIHNNYYFTDNGGSAVTDDDSAGPESGLVMAYSDEKVRLWAPSRNNGNPNGWLVHNCNGWGGERNCINGAATFTRTFVRVVAWRQLLPGFAPFQKSVSMTAGVRRNTDGTSAAQRVLTGYPTKSDVWHEVVCFVENGAYAHNGRGAAGVDNDGPAYGGLIVGYRSDIGQIRLWTAGSHSQSSGNSKAFLSFASDGWSGQNEFEIKSGTVRCNVWPSGPAPTFDSDWFIFASQQNTNSYREVQFYNGAENLSPPLRVKVLIQARGGNNNQFVFEAMGTGAISDQHSGQTYNSYGGLLYSYNNERVRMWAPDKHTGRSTSGAILFLSDGWGSDIFTQTGSSSTSAFVRVLVWY